MRNSVLNVAILLVCCISHANAYSQSIFGKTIEKLAVRIINYFEVDETISNNHGKNKSIRYNEISANKCNTIEKINDYFFDVYGNDDGRITDIDGVIRYSMIKGGNEKYEIKQKKFRCDLDNCLAANEIKTFFNTTVITKENFASICPVLLYNYQLDGCDVPKENSYVNRITVWLVGYTLAAIVTCAAWSGSIVIPFLGSKHYRTILTFMIGLASGCLIANSFLKFIPSADGFSMTFTHNLNSSFFYKHLLILLVFLFYFLVDRTLKLVASYQKKKNDVKQVHKKISIGSKASVNDGSVISVIDAADTIINKIEVSKTIKKSLKKQKSIDLKNFNIAGATNIFELNEDLIERINEPSKICCTSLLVGLKDVKPIGWMALFGDGLCNCIDGLSIGAALNQSLTEGLIVALAVFLYGIPQELGDFALLVKAGFTPFQALFYNFVSSCSIYVGFTIGCFTGEAIKTARWIFAISGASTLYIGLGVLLPEMMEDFENTRSFEAKVKITIVQLSGFITGYMVMIVLNLYEENIQL